MRAFSDFVNEGIIKKQSPDTRRAENLRKQSARTYDFLIDIIKNGITNENANSIITICYDVLLESIRARMLEKGYNSSGAGAHEAEISYLKLLNFSDIEIHFADQLRFFRNRITYYGKELDKEYAEKVVEFTKRIYPKLK